VQVTEKYAAHSVYDGAVWARAYVVLSVSYLLSNSIIFSDSINSYLRSKLCRRLHNRLIKPKKLLAIYKQNPI